MGRRKQSNPQQNNASPPSEVLGRITIDPDEPLVNYLAAQCFLEEHEKHTNEAPVASRDCESDKKLVAQRQEATRELRLKKKRRGAILDDDDESDKSSDEDLTLIGKGQSKSNRQRKQTIQNKKSEDKMIRAKVVFEDDSDCDEAVAISSIEPRATTTGSTRRKKKKQSRSTVKSKDDPLQKASEIIVWRRDDGVCNLKYIAEHKECRIESGCMILREIDLPPSEYCVQVAERESEDLSGDRKGNVDTTKILPLIAGKSICFLAEHLSISHQKESLPQSELKVANLARCIEDSTFVASLCASDAGWKLKISICPTAFEVCKPPKLPLNYRPSTARYQPAHRVTLALAELFGITHLEAGRNNESSIKAKTVYDCIDNCQIEKIQSQHSGSLPNDGFDIPGLIPKLRPYQIAAVRWMVQRETTHQPCDAWKYAWLVLTSFKSDEIPIALPVWEKRRSVKDEVFFCPLMGWLATSVDEARRITLGGDGLEPNDAAVRGGILAESMGLGKTVEILALILARTRPYERNPPAQRALFGNTRNRTLSEPLTAMAEQDFTVFGDTQSSDSEGSSSDRTLTTTNANISTPCTKVTHRPANPALITPQALENDGRESHREERFLDDHETLLGSCLCGEQIDLERIRNNAAIVLCCRCNEPMHMQCAGFSGLTDMQASTKEMRYRKMYSNEQWSCWLTDSYRQCPCCVADRGDVIKSRCTLIVTPPAILNQWEREIKRHTMDRRTGKSLRVMVYSGVEKVTKSRKNMTCLHPHHLADHDIVLTTFDGLMSDFGHSDENKYVGNDRSSNLRKRKRYRVVPTPLSAIEWWRVCLDEAQRVERPTATSALMALKLRALNRWCVTGTPVGRGKLEDLYGLLLFIRMAPYEQRSFFCKALNPSHPDILDRIKGTLDNVVWRSTKCNEIVRKQMGVPEQAERTNRLRFSSIEKHFYERQLEQTLQSAGDFVERRKSGKQDKTRQLNMLAEHLHRLRAACCHPQVGAGGLAKSKVSQGGVGQRIMTMSEILIKLIDDARLKCEESQRNVIMHTNGMAALARLKVDARNRGIVVKENDFEALTKSCSLYLEALQLAASNSSPVPILAEAGVRSTGFRNPRSVLKGGRGVLEWKLDTISSILVATVDFDGPARRCNKIKLKPKHRVPNEMTQEVSDDFKWGIFAAKTCILEVANTSLGGAFVEVSRFSCGEEEDWYSVDGFYTNKSRNWRLILTDFSEVATHKQTEVNSCYVGVEVLFEEADIASDTLQRLHSLHNAHKSFEALDNLGGESKESGMKYDGVDVNERMYQLDQESNTIELLYMQRAQTLHSACASRFNEVSLLRRKAEEVRQLLKGAKFFIFNLPLQIPLFFFYSLLLLRWMTSGIWDGGTTS